MIYIYILHLIHMISTASNSYQLSQSYLSHKCEETFMTQSPMGPATESFQPCSDQHLQLRVPWSSQIINSTVGSASNDTRTLNMFYFEVSQSGGNYPQNIHFNRIFINPPVPPFQETICALQGTLAMASARRFQGIAWVHQHGSPGNGSTLPNKLANKRFQQNGTKQKYICKHNLTAE